MKRRLFRAFAKPCISTGVDLISKITLRCVHQDSRGFHIKASVGAYGSAITKWGLLTKTYIGMNRKRAIENNRVWARGADLRGKQRVRTLGSPVEYGFLERIPHSWTS